MAAGELLPKNGPKLPLNQRRINPEPIPD